MNTLPQKGLLGDDRGSEPVAVAILGLPMILLIGLIVVAGRVAVATESIAGVAGAAAREASIARTATQADTLATANAVASLHAQGLHCRGTPAITVDTSGFSAPPGQAATVTVTVTCVVTLSDIGMPGLPGDRTLHDRATSPLDPYRGIGFRSAPATVSAVVSA